MTYSLEPAGLRLRSIKWLLYQAAHTVLSTPAGGNHGHYQYMRTISGIDPYTARCCLAIAAAVGQSLDLWQWLLALVKGDHLELQSWCPAVNSQQDQHYNTVHCTAKHCNTV